MKLFTGTMISFCVVFLMFGCGLLKDEPVEQETSSEEVPDYERIPSLVPVADYTGEEYELRDADPDMEISAEMEAEIETAVKDFFIENYKTEVKMNRYFHGDGYVRAVVESIGDPLFYTEVNVGLEKDGDTVIGVNGVGAPEMEIEQAITSGLLAVSREEQFENLDRLIEGFAAENPVRGMNEEVVNTVTAKRYATPYYFISHGDEDVFLMLDDYLSDEEFNKAEWKQKYHDLPYNPERVNILIELFMSEADEKPDQKLIDKLAERIKNAENLPRGGYVISLHDSNIIGRVGTGHKENSLNTMILNPIIVEGQDDQE